MGIAAHGIAKKFGNFIALDDVDLDVPSGQLTALLGPCGGGKSTLLRIIGGLESPDRGSVVIDGVESTRVPAQRRNVGFVFQHYAAFKHLSVYRNVAFGLEVRTRPKAEIRPRAGAAGAERRQPGLAASGPSRRGAGTQRTALSCSGVAHPRPACGRMARWRSQRRVTTRCAPCWRWRHRPPIW